MGDVKTDLGDEFRPKRSWWLLIGIIVFISAWLRLTGYNFSLPYIDHPDEPNFNLAARSILDVGTARPLGIDSYPPGIVTINYLFLRFLADPQQPPSSVIQWVRLVSVAAGVGNVVLAALIARRTYSESAALVAATISAVMPPLVTHSRYATADTLVAFFTMLALLQVMTGARRNRNGWITWGMASFMLAVIFKYQALFILPILLTLSLWRLTVAGWDKSTIQQHFVTLLLILGIFFFWLIAISPMLNANDIPYWVAPTNRIGLPSPQLLVNNFLGSIRTVWLTPLWSLGATGVVLSIWHSGKMDWRTGTIAVIGCALLWLGGLSLFGAQDIRQFIAMLNLLAVLLGVGIAALSHLVERLLALSRYPIWASEVGQWLIVLLLIFPYAQTSIVQSIPLTLPDTHNALATWMDATLAPGGYVADVSNHKTFNPHWGGYRGVNIYTLIEQASLFARPLSEWQALDAAYAIMPYDEYRSALDSREQRAILDRVTLLKTFAPDSQFRGPSMVILLLRSMQTSLDQRRSSVHLLGYDLTSQSISPGDMLGITYYWRADHALDAEYTVFSHLLDETGRLVAQVDGPPMPDVRRPTNTWDDPEEILVSRLFTLPIPDDLAPGTYALISGFYRAGDGVRLAAEDGSTSILVRQIRIQGT